MFIHGRKHLLIESVLETVCSVCRRSANNFLPRFFLIRALRPISGSGLGGNYCYPNHRSEKTLLMVSVSREREWPTGVTIVKVSLAFLRSAAGFQVNNRLENSHSPSEQPAERMLLGEAWAAVAAVQY